MSVSKTPRKPVRERILETACELFYREGIQNVGIDRIIAESGVAKMSLYNHFKSKDALIEAFLRQRDQQWREWFVTRVEERSDDPKQRLLSLFDVLQEWFENPNFRGCAFINATVELANPHHPGCQAALDHQLAVYQYIFDLVKAEGLEPAESFARQLLLLVQGAIVIAMMQDRPQAAAEAKSAATLLLNSDGS
ncbi:TetR/AcrR family transcriptional regulator [Acaryochloris marina]|uniref:Transcriptional regulator, TetR family n=1 Tax=Acaryochloris marina (strain MBIC 11017) TaxID=329726 RepID=B0C406_ACAM1|nr:TetR/AcrR family transcriptional regulator [Acaryochloris marina]ABW26266.1 transcriptional regulator, TetR family [Acaryochloris marina MBIC11017]BDM81093.1 TetR family transcriptional regulator [Acaryochloris marina MBIC10699]